MNGMTNDQFRGVIKMILKEVEEIHDEESKRQSLEKIKALLDD